MKCGAVVGLALLACSGQPEDVRPAPIVGSWRSGSVCYDGAGDLQGFNMTLESDGTGTAYLYAVCWGTDYDITQTYDVSWEFAVHGYSAWQAYGVVAGQSSRSGTNDMH